MMCWTTSPMMTTDALPLTVAYAAAAGVSGYVLIRFVQKYIEHWNSPLLAMPGPKRKSFLVGNFFDVFRAPFMDPHKEWIRTFQSETGKVPPLISYSSLFGSWSVVVMDCDIVQEILMDPGQAKEPLRFPKNYDFLKYIIGEGIVVLEGETWSRHRRVLQPCFQHRHIRDSLIEAIPAVLEKFLAAWANAPPGRVIDAASHMSALTLDILGLVSFSHDFQGVQTVEDWAKKDTSQGSNDELNDIADPLIQALKESFKLSILDVFCSIVGASRWVNVLDHKARRARQMLDQAAQEILQKTRKDNADRHKNHDGPTIGPKSLLDQMLNAQQEPNGRNFLNEAELCNEITTFIVAGHDTTSTWCLWALYALGLYPDIQEKVFQDVRKCRAAPDGTVLSLSEVEAMDYLWAFLQEVLRFFSPVGMITRHTAQDEHWRGYTVPKGTRLCIPIHLLHRHADQWTEPDVFRPERWLNRNDGPTRHRFAFLPFSHGPRDCIGRQFATIEAKMIIANLVDRFRIKLDPSTAESGVSFTVFIAMKSKLPVKIQVAKRSID
jgi:cytochrome P450